MKIFFGQVMYRQCRLKVGKFQADQMLFVEMTGRKAQN